jgi:hypothetical protein
MERSFCKWNGLKWYRKIMQQAISISYKSICAQPLFDQALAFRPASKSKKIGCHTRTQRNGGLKPEDIPQSQLFDGGGLPLNKIVGRADVACARLFLVEQFSSLGIELLLLSLALTATHKGQCLRSERGRKYVISGHNLSMLALAVIFSSSSFLCFPPFSLSLHFKSNRGGNIEAIFP